MNDNMEKLTPAEIAFKLQRIYSDNYFCSPGYLREINYFKPEVINCFSSEANFLLTKKPKVDAFISISSEYIGTKKIEQVLRFTEGWTLLAFDTYVNQSIQIISSIRSSQKAEVPKNNNQFFRKFAVFSDRNISSVFQP